MTEIKNISQKIDDNISRNVVNTLNVGIGFTEQKCSYFLTFLKILTAISRINEPIPGMFVLI